MPTRSFGVDDQSEMPAEVERLLGEVVGDALAPLIEVVVLHLLLGLLFVGFLLLTVGWSFLAHRGGRYPDPDE